MPLLILNDDGSARRLGTVTNRETFWCSNGQVALARVNIGHHELLVCPQPWFVVQPLSIDGVNMPFTVIGGLANRKRCKDATRGLPHLTQVLWDTTREIATMGAARPPFLGFCCA